MKDIELINKLSSLIGHEEPIVREFILQTIEQVASSNLSVEANVKKSERLLDRKIKELEGVNS